jgi:uncharacterized protein
MAAGGRWIRGMGDDSKSPGEWPAAMPPYAYVPGHGLPHPVNDSVGHSFGRESGPPMGPAALEGLPTDPAVRRRVIAGLLVDSPEWHRAVALFNEGFYWEAHEAWELFWNALGRTTPDARAVQGLIHLAAAGVKIREGRPAGVARHVQRARELLAVAPPRGESVSGSFDCPGIDGQSVANVIGELEGYRRECWHTSRALVVSVVAGKLRVAATQDRPERAGGVAEATG